MRLETIIIGAGQAGLALSYCLSKRGVSHVVIERGLIAERWTSQRWESLRLLTPNWQTRLPGWQYRGDDRNGFMTAKEFASFLRDYAASFGAPVLERTAVLSVDGAPGAFVVTTSAGRLFAANVVVATGHAAKPSVPALARNLDRRFFQTTPTAYRNPASLPDGGVLIVGASASGVQLARELAEAGRYVVLSVGRHNRMPRSYAGRDIMWWMDRAGILEDRVANERGGRRHAPPSLQLVGSTDGRNVDLPALEDLGVTLVGRTRGMAGSQAYFARDLWQTTNEADLRLSRVLDRIDLYANRIEPAGARRVERPRPYICSETLASVDMAARNIRSVVWATGFRRSYPWLRFPVVRRNGDLEQTEGITPVEGLFALGLMYMRRRNSSFIDGVGADAEFIADHILSRLESRHCIAA